MHLGRQQLPGLGGVEIRLGLRLLECVGEPAEAADP
jgi:hypothetical protein